MSGELEVPRDATEARERLGELAHRMTMYLGAFGGLELVTAMWGQTLYGVAHEDQRKELTAFCGILPLLSQELDAIAVELECLTHPSSPFGPQRAVA